MQSVAVTANDSAKRIAALVNEKTSVSGVKATARTITTMSDLSADGTVSFTLYGANTTGASISAGVTTTDLSSLVYAINQKAATTGITATLDAGSSSLTLLNANGEDIKIEDFRHSAAVTDTTGATDVEQTINVTGQLGSAATLTNGGMSVLGAQVDSTTVGGKVTFSSDKSYTVYSSIAGEAGSLFTGNANVEHGSALNQVATMDISTLDGANDAIAVVDGALAQVNSVRADLGAIQNRFETTIANLAASSENLTAAKSRVMDADYAAETGALTKQMIMQQAGISILAQANTLPQQVLTLLSGR
jgi:flagellin